MKKMRKFVPLALITIFFFLTPALFLIGPAAAQAPDFPPPKGTDFTPSAQDGNPVASSPFQIERDLLSKIEPQLLKRVLTAEGTAPFIVYLKTQADVQTIAALSANAQEQPDETARRAAIVNALQQTAQNSQAGVVQFLNNSAAPGGLSGQSVATTNINPLWIVNAVAAEGSLETVLALAARSDVEIIRLDKKIQLTLPPTPYIGQRRPLPLISDLQSPPWNIARIRANLVHKALGLDGDGVVVANVDTGVDWRHIALQSKYRGYTGAGHLPRHQGNWYDVSGDGANYPIDGNGHGTHTMGTMVGDGVGVAPGARWIAVKAFNSAGQAQNSTLHQAFEWLLAPNGDPGLAPDIINNSWSNSNGASIEFEADIRALLAAGIYPFFSAGNNGPNIRSVGSPGSLQIGFAVGATTIDDEVGNFTGRGPSPWGQIKPDISAPGKEIVSTFPGDAYSSLEGTSMAAPHVSGLAALLLQAAPHLKDNLPEISRVITSTAVPLGDTIPNNNYGWGRIDAYNAVMAVADAGTLQGAVTQAGNGSPIGNANIQITPRNGGPTINARSNPNGAYLQGMAAGTYDLSVTAFGYQPAAAFNMTVITGAATTRNFALLPAPVGVLQGAVRDKTTNAPLAATITIAGTPATAAANPNDGRYRLVLPVGTYTVKVVAEGHRVGRAANITIGDGATVTRDFLLDRAPSILLVDGGRWYQESQINYYQQALNDLAYTYDTLQITKPFETPGDVPLTSTLSAYDIVIWSSPEDSPGYIGADAALSGFLDGGGKLLLSGQDVAYFDSGSALTIGASPYLRTYLKTRFVKDDAGTDVVAAAPDGPLAGLTLTISGNGGADNQKAPDIITVADQDFAGAALRYDDDSATNLAAAHVGLCVPYRAMFLSFGFEGINSRTERSQLLEQAIDWLRQSPPARGVELTPRSETRVGDFGTVVDHLIRIRNVGTQPDNYRLSFDSKWPINPRPPAAVSQKSCQPQAIIVGVRVDTTARHVSDVLTLTARAADNSAISDSVTRITKSPAPVLLVDDDRFLSFAAEYKEALEGNNIVYDYQKVPRFWSGPSPPSPSLKTLQMYPIVVWYTAYDWFQPLTAEEEERLAAYLDGGGRLFFSSQDYMYNLPNNKPSPFARKYLGVLSHTEDDLSATIFGQMGHLISTNLGPYPLTFPPGYRNATDALVPTGQAQVTTTGEEGRPNGLNNTGVGPEGDTWRTVFLAYGPEVMAESARAKLLQRAVGWLGWSGTSTTRPDRAAALAGEKINYTAVVANDDQKDLATAYFTATFPVALQLDATSSSPELTLSEGKLIWSGPLAKNERKVLRYAAVITDSLPLGSLISQTSWIAYDDHRIAVDRVANVCVNCPELEPESVFKATPAQDVQPDDVLTYTIVLKNTGLVDDPLVTTTNTLPPMLGLVSVDEPAQGAVIRRGATLTWTTSLARGEAATLTYRAVISYRTSQFGFENVARVDDVTSLPPVILKAPAEFKIFPVYFPIIYKN